MIRAADIVADHLRRVAADKHRAGIGEAGEKRLGAVNGELDMLGGDAVGERQRLLQGRRR